MRGPSEVKELRMIDTSTRVVPILKSFFLLEKKAAVPLHCVVAKIQESLTSQLSQGGQNVCVWVSRVSCAQCIKDLVL